MNERTLESFITEHGIESHAHYCGDRFEPDDRDRKRFYRVHKWSVALTSKTFGRYGDVEYTMGDGLRHILHYGRPPSRYNGPRPVGWKEGAGGAMRPVASSRGMTLYDMERYNASKLDIPDTSSVLNSLKSDASYADQSFSDWCAEYGYDKDSRAAERTYNVCTDTLAKLRAWLGPQAFGELLECEPL